MSLREICFYKLPPLADDCLLLLWRVASMQQEALSVLVAWGFKLKSEVVWCKVTKQGKPRMGMGRYTRASHETCLLATRGRVNVADHGVCDTFAAPVGRHSEKPDEIYRIAERLVPGGPFVELFARRRRQGWQAYGNELSEAAE
jgi:N6-adenosine-specific RNA methylase IME4